MDLYVSESLYIRTLSHMATCLHFFFIQTYVKKGTITSSVCVQ